MRKILAWLILSSVAVAAGSVQAARPFVTDDARVVDRGGCQIETFLKDQQRVGEREFWILPACNPWGAELTAGYIRVDSALSGDTNTTVLQAKMLLKPLETNGSGFALSVGTFLNAKTSPYFNAIGSFSLADDHVVLHANLGTVRDNIASRSRGTWGAGAEVLLAAPRFYGILESYGQTGEKPTLHTGLRVWLVPNRMQLDTTVGRQSTVPERRFATLGLRVLW